MIGKTNSNFWHIANVACLAALAGCSFNPDYHRPALPVANSYTAETAEHATDRIGAMSEYADWQDFFIDPELQALIRQGLKSNRDLRSTAFRVKEAQAAYGIKNADLFPSLSGSAAAARLGLPAEITPIANGKPVSQYIAGFNTSWEIDFWGRVQSLSDSALNEYLATQSAELAARNILIIQIADTYLNLLDLNERLAIARQSVLSRQKSYDMLKKRYEIGSGNKLDLVQSETLLTQAQTLVTQLGLNRSMQINLMTLLIGDGSTYAPTTSGLKDNVMATNLGIGQPSDLLLRRPDIVAAEFRLKAANANIGAARAAFFPRITLNAAYGGISTELNGLFSSNNRAWMFAPNISVPIFEGGRLSSNLDLSEARKDIAIANYEKTIQVAFKEVSDNLNATQALDRQIDIQLRAVAAQKERLRLASMRYDNGSSSYFEVLDAERDLLSVQQQYVQLKRALFSTRANLFNTLGGASNTETKSTSVPNEQIMRSN
ncbi:efflux transporter outer membrane subunit [Orrella sp. NBD-18]|uniref:Efflux transporter outer membrane subunit n=1 Tax=Sheuella amnicola TaxID=2707330 RepID=A0A6B2QVZ1_9BURK|nr:efflux transporter outer membrane subunit [Sheuella amnicola]NDY82806.1 efflux transporter outer membrane subunit [Sheuella amnicola]